jgi:hypothetical protein
MKKKSKLKYLKELSQLNEEFVLTQKMNEKEKKEFSKFIKQTNPNEIKNTIFVETKITLWDRIKKSLGIS